jgi:hypothetical protein
MINYFQQSRTTNQKRSLAISSFLEHYNFISSLSLVRLSPHRGVAIIRDKVKLAFLIHWTGVDKDTGEKLLAVNQGNLRQAIANLLRLRS